MGTFVTELFDNIEMSKPRFIEILDRLSNWKKIHVGLKFMQEDEVRELLYVELKSRQRFAMVQRLRGRLNLLRNARELNEIMAFLSLDKQ